MIICKDVLNVPWDDIAFQFRQKAGVRISAYHGAKGNRKETRLASIDREEVERQRVRDPLPVVANA